VLTIKPVISNIIFVVVMLLFEDMSLYTLRHSLSRAVMFTWKMLFWTGNQTEQCPPLTTS